MDSLAAAIASFTSDFIKVLNKNKKNDNIFFCSPSILSAFGMVLLGAKRNTALEMEKVLHLGESKGIADAGTEHTSEENVCKQTTVPPPSLPEQQCGQEGTVHSKFHELLSNLLKSDQDCELRIANKLYGQNSFPFVEQYLSCVQKLYMAMLETVDFKNSEEVRKKINTWVETETNGKIKDLFTQGSIQPETSLVVVNAVYFNAKWDKEFKKENTKEMQFHLNKRESKLVKMMYQNGKFKVASIPEMHMKILELFYCEKKLSMVILLPDELADDSTGLEKIENGLTSKKLAEWTSALQETDVDVYFPTFQLEEIYDLKLYLQEMGMRDLFSNKADLSGISNKIGLKVSKAVHKTVIKVDEKGTEAAAATGITIVPLSLPIRFQFIADHPFIFLIIDNTTKAILFYGRYCSP
uniref:Serpin B4-like n=1 Tax=Geotrypetes seraphini TaxID=260995 RepID=A0A6P8P902_GEOSA|nr:serpin B4-like [Geotrypetes seraphini]XP_033785716.1 serpin B4-like [Geotrypetes seraphini]XP_033785717.1 serpin B4-like [Geotrypetes seraphini]